MKYMKSSCLATESKAAKARLPNGLSHSGKGFPSGLRLRQMLETPWLRQSDGRRWSPIRNKSFRRLGRGAPGREVGHASPALWKSSDRAMFSLSVSSSSNFLRSHQRASAIMVSTSPTPLPSHPLTTHLPGAQLRKSAINALPFPRPTSRLPRHNRRRANSSPKSHHGSEHHPRMREMARSSPQRNISESQQDTGVKFK